MAEPTNMRGFRVFVNSLPYPELTLKKFKANEIFLWHHVGYFPQEVELAMLSEFAEAVIKPMSTVTA